MKARNLLGLAPMLFLILLSAGCGAIEKSAASINTKNGLPGNTYTVWQTAPSGIFPKNDTDGSEVYQFDKNGNYTVTLKEQVIASGKYVIEKTLVKDVTTGQEIFTVENIGGVILRAKKTDGTKIFCKNEAGTNGIYGIYELKYLNDGATKGSVMAGTLSVWENAGYIQMNLTKTYVSIKIVDKKNGGIKDFGQLPYKRLNDDILLDMGMTIKLMANFGGYTEARLIGTSSSGKKMDMKFNAKRV